MTLPKLGTRTIVALTAFACLALALGWPEWRMVVQALYYKTGTIHDLGTLGGPQGTLGGASSFARSIDDRGRVIGFSESSSGQSRAFI
jgi:hypothetical protein